MSHRYASQTLRAISTRLLSVVYAGALRPDATCWTDGLCGR